MTKKKKIFAVILIIIVVVIGMFTISEKVMPVRMNWIDENGNKIHVWLSKEDGETIKNITDMRENSFYPHSCGYDFNKSFDIGFSKCIMSSNYCTNMFYHFRFSYIPDEEIQKVWDIVAKYGGFVI